MKKAIRLPIPVLRILRKIGQDINNARRRRRITVSLMAERANLSRATVDKIQRGNPKVSMGGYTAVLFVLGMTDRLRDIAGASHDLTGLILEEERLQQRICMPRSKSRDSDE